MVVNPLNIKVITEDGVEIYFTMKPTTPLKKLMDAFCNRHLRQGISPLDLRFLFDGNRINETQTPQHLDMEDGDVIDVHLHERWRWPAIQQLTK